MKSVFHPIANEQQTQFGGFVPSPDIADLFDDLVGLR
jgi:hypothetical protein